MKRLTILSTIFLSAILICCASASKEEPVVKSNVIADSSGINLLNQNRYVNDFTFLFTKEQQSFLDSLIGEYEIRTTNQIAVATIDSNTLGKYEILDFAKTLGKKWGVGQKEKHNGVTMVICVEKRQVAIATGYGLEKILPTDTLNIIIENIIKPEYKQSNYFAGTKAGLLAIMERAK